MSAAPKDLRLQDAARVHSNPPAARRMVLSGWGRYPNEESEVSRPEKIAELQAVVAFGNTSASTSTLIARGAGRAYGDAALNKDSRVVDVQRLDRMLSFDPDSAVLRCEAGVTISEIIDVFLPRGFFPFVVPGTRYVTVGGAVAADIHGKSHHRDSSFANSLLSFDLLLASGEVRRCSREENAELFWATVGGMGLTGVIIETELRLRRVESAWLEGALIRTANVDEAIEAFDRTDSEYGQSVAWIDCASTRAALGRSVINVGNFAARDALPPRLAQEPLRIAPRMHPVVPFNLPEFTVSALTVKAFNAVIYATHRTTDAHPFFDYQSFFFPLDSFRNWNRIYGTRGFVQYQCVWPMAESRAGLIETLEATARSGRGSLLAVLKKFGAQEGVLSFPMPGYTLALDFPVSDGLFEFLDGLDEMVM